jgi:phage terminase large subunit GpA-like protein
MQGVPAGRAWIGGAKLQSVEPGLRKEVEMRCPACGRFTPLSPDVTGVWRGLHDEIVAVAYLCECGNNRSIPIGRATMRQQAEALEKEKEGMRVSGTI